jgi:putative ABC transport system permease protein
MRLFRREWRQQLLVLTLLTVTVAAAILGATAVYNGVPSGAREFGSANHYLDVRGGDPAALAANVAALRSRLGTVDVIGHRRAPVPGTVESVDIRSQDPNGPYSGPMLALKTGRFPSAAGEIGVTDRAATLLRVHVGSHFTLDREARTVVGLVENPAGADDEFVLVPPRFAAPPTSVTVLASGPDDAVLAAAGIGRGDGGAGSTRLVDGVASRGKADKSVAAGLVLALASVVLLLVCLVAAAGFAVIAQRRLRQMGMLATVGATDRHLRLVVVANGFVVGAVAAVAGAVLAVLGWLAVAPLLASAVGHRINRFDVAWWVFGAGMALAVVTATAAAWWPGRTMARVPITQALSARPPRPSPVHRSGLVALGFLVGGFVMLTMGINTVRDHVNPVLLIAGTLAVAIGVLFVCPLAIRSLATGAGRLPVAARLAMRDLARHQARSSAALAAISLGLGIAVATVVIATAATPTRAQGNLSDRQVLIRTGDDQTVPERTPAELSRLQADVDGFAASLGSPAVVPLAVAVNLSDRIDGNLGGPFPGKSAPVPVGTVLHPAVTLGRQLGTDAQGRTTHRYVTGLYVATPALLSHLGLDAQAAGDADVLVRAAVNTGVLEYINTSKRDAAKPTVKTIDVSGYSSSPTSLITPAAMTRNGWTASPAGWFIEASTPLTDAQLASARDMAAAAGLTVETRHAQRSLATTRAAATAAGMLLALAILAMTVGLIRSEAAGDLRTLTATGATSTTRRTLTGATAGALALLGVTLGIGGAYLALLAAYRHRLTPLGHVPIVELLVIFVGVPVAATAAGWLLAGREPPSIARLALE